MTAGTRSPRRAAPGAAGAGAGADVPGVAGATRGEAARPRAELVLDAFEQRARREGIRAVVMSALARELGMSTKTLYREYPSKDALVEALVERWGAQLLEVQERRLAADVPDRERARVVVHHIARWRARFCDQFWSDLRADHPEVWSRHASAAREVRGRVRDWVAAAVRPGVDPDFARSMLDAMVRRALQPEVRAASGLGRRAAIDAAVDLWALGVLADPDGRTIVPPRAG